MENEDGENAPVLSDLSLNALKEFYSDRDAREKLFEDLKSAARIEDEVTKATLSMDPFSENWSESQFWYSQDTATVLANQLLRDSTKSTSIAVISAPSVFVQLKNLLATSKRTKMETPVLYLLEFDERFSVFPEFIHYDFRNPFKLPLSMRGTIDNIICDPPFLSDECQTKAALTVRWLSRSWGINPTTPTESNKMPEVDQVSRLIVCTGERMENLVNRLYRPQGIGTTTFMPEHAKGLSNEFYCYANFICSDWDWKE